MKMIGFEDYFAIQALYATYAAALDENRLETWPDFFVEDGEYKLQSRENFDGGFRLATIWCEGHGMMKDRIYSILKTLYYERYFQHHVVSAPRIVGVEGGVFHTEANYVVHRTKRGQFPQLLNLGRYVDTIVKVGGEMKLQNRLCVFDNELIPNSLIYPI
jgi:salicylate 5-hydroxylase small subunit